jgi:pilus assembly protein FimV
MELKQNMKNILGWTLAALLLPGQVLALGLGKLTVESSLNEPLEARIELLSPTREELDSLAVGLADNEAFERAGIERLFMLSGLRFELTEDELGPDYIRVFSRDPIREPFLNFLVEINWSRGRLLREYTVLLDPPYYEPGMRAPAVSLPAPSGEAAEPAPAEPAVAAPGETGAAAYTGGDYGPTVAHDTLWSIASRMRPGDAVSVQQMMLALYRTNPEAFIGNNINGLRRGHILRMPSEAELNSLTREQAIAEVLSHHAAWEPSARAASAPQPASAAAAAPAAPAPVPQAAAPAPKEAELRLVAPGKAKAGNGEAAGGTGAAGGASLQLANEQLAVLTQENIDLKERLTEAETIIEDLKRLIALKDDELATLQSQLAGAEKAAPVAAPAAPAAPEAAPAAEKPAAPAPTRQEKPAPQKAKAEAPVAPAARPGTPAAEVTAPAAGGVVDRMIGLVRGNLLIIAGVAGAIVLVAGALVFMARRKQAEAVAAEDEAAAAVQFPDFTGSEEETILPGAAEAEAAPAVEERRPAPEPKVAPKAAAPAAAAPAVAAPATASASAPAPAAGAPQEDPLAEVNVFLAYEHFDQAEEFVREAIKREPDNLDFHSKLLEVFYAANDRRKYEEAARVLHDKVGGSGPHWDMALAMWQEMSPNRALFAAAAGEEELAGAAATGVGRIDLTAKEKSAPGEDAGLDFDLGEMTAGAAPAAEAAGEDVLDVTAAVGLESDESLLGATGAGDTGEVLDLTGGQGGGEAALAEPVAASDDLLDVTAHSNLESTGLDENLLDVTVAAPKGGDAKEESPVADTGGALDFDLNLDLPVETEAAAAGAEDSNVIEFDSGLDKASTEGGLELDLGADLEAPATGAGGLDLDITAGSGPESETPAEASADEGGLASELSLEGPSGEGELTLDTGTGDEGGLEDSGLALETSAGEGELTLDTGETGGDSGLELVVEQDDGGDQTVFVPRSDGLSEQSAEDELATNLDLAKALVELGDKDSAKELLDNIVAKGNDEQRRQAQELLQQVT